MSDNFLRVAQKEVKEDIDDIEAIINSCKNDSDISASAIRIEKHLHKIKGLSPMMGQNDLGEISQLADKLIKHIMAKGPVRDSYQILLESVKTMKQLLNGDAQNTETLKEKIKQAF
ncbi:MAG: Hpt domain-containing protein [Nitrosopumilales archaeon]|nr:Hpt domain-containing protein [Nitrosopumilales archaeon]